MTPTLFLVAALAFAGQPDAGEVLARARAQIPAALERLPRYTCVQTVDRSYRRLVAPRGRGCDQIVADRARGAARLKPIATDRLRLDVAISDAGREIYAWAGAPRIDHESAAELAGGGPFGTGAFGPFLLNIFGVEGVEFSYGDRLSGGGAHEYRFRVPLEVSRYKIDAPGGPVFFPFDGAFWLDPGAAEVARLRVRTSELPAATGTCEATTTVDFQRVRLGAGEFLLPKASRLQFIARNGDEWENNTRYTACREFRGESEIRFEEAGPAKPAAAEPAGPQGEATQADLNVRLRLENEIDTATAAAGDPVAASVVKDVIDPVLQRVVVPARALARGRIIRMAHRVDPPAYFLIGIAFESVEFLGKSRPFFARLRLPVELPGGGAPLGEIQSHTKFPITGVLVFRSREPRYVVPRGFEAEWKTVTP